MTKASEAVAYRVSRRQVLRALAMLVSGAVTGPLVAGCGGAPTATVEPAPTATPASPTLATPTTAIEPAPTATTPANSTATSTAEPSPSAGEPLLTIDYARSGGRIPPRDRELLLINPDGSFSMWRSVSNATQPPTPIGRFAGQLEPQTQAELQQAAARAVEAGNFELTPPPGAAVETITLDQIEARLGANDEPEGGWAALIGELRRLLGGLTASPQAAISLELVDGGQAARLVQQGPDELQLDLSELTVRAVLWEGINKPGDWRAGELPAGATTNIKAGPGWTFDLPFNHGFQIAPGQEVVAYVTFVAFDGERAIPVALETGRSSQN